jgi:hypothetical protein
MVLIQSPHGVDLKQFGAARAEQPICSELLLHGCGDMCRVHLHALEFQKNSLTPRNGCQTAGMNILTAPDGYTWWICCKGMHELDTKGSPAVPVSVTMVLCLFVCACVYVYVFFLRSINVGKLISVLPGKPDLVT